MLSACGGGSDNANTSSNTSSSSNNSGSTATVANQAPTDSSTALVGEVVSLLVQKPNSDSSAISYTWEQISGPEVLDLVEDSNTLTFTTPKVSEDTEAQFKVTVTDGSGGVTEKLFIVIIEKPFYSFVINGVIGAEPLANATVTLKVNGKAYTTTSEEGGAFAFSLTLGHSSKDKVITLESKGLAPNEHIALSTVLGSVENVSTASGDDNIVSMEELPVLKLNSYSTALHVLLEGIDSESNIDNQVELEHAFSRVSSSNISALTKVIRAAVLYGGSSSLLALPAGFSDTIALARNLRAAAKYLNNIQEVDPDTYKQISESWHHTIPKWNIDSTSSLVGNYYGIRQGDEERGSNPSRLTFHDDGTGHLVDSSGDFTFDWWFEGNSLITTLKNEQSLSRYRTCRDGSNIRRCSKYLSQLSISSRVIFPGVNAFVINKTIREYVVLYDGTSYDRFKTEHHVTPFYEEKDVLEVSDAIEFDKKYVVALPNLHITSDIDGLRLSESYNVAKMVFSNETEQQGKVSIELPSFTLSGDKNSIVSGTWNIADNKGLNILFEENDAIKSMNIAFFHNKNSKLIVHILSEYDSIPRIASGPVLVEADKNNISANASWSGIYQWRKPQIELLSHSWLELNDDGTVSQFYVYDKNKNAEIEEGEVEQYSGYWRISDNHTLFIRTYKSSLNEDACLPAEFDVSATSECELYREWEWEVFDMTSVANLTEISAIQRSTSRYRLSADNNDVLPTLISFWQVGLLKTSERPIALPEG